MSHYLCYFRSESVSEKLLTHWLSICLYHNLKDQTGSSLFILYKAIKIQVERGPVDYMTNCAKYTLAENKIYTDADVNPATQLVCYSFFIFYIFSQNT